MAVTCGCERNTLGTIEKLCADHSHAEQRRCHGLIAREQTMHDALRRMVQAVNRLGERDGLLTYFEHDVTKNAEAQRRWKELNDAGVQAARALSN